MPPPRGAPGPFQAQVELEHGPHRVKAQYARPIARIADDAVHLHCRVSLSSWESAKKSAYSRPGRAAAGPCFFARAAADLAGSAIAGMGTMPDSIKTGRCGSPPADRGFDIHTASGLSPFSMSGTTMSNMRASSSSVMETPRATPSAARPPFPAPFWRRNGTWAGRMRISSTGRMRTHRAILSRRALAGHEVGAEVATDHGGAKLARMPLRLDEQASCADGPLLAAIVIGPAFARLPHAFALRLSGPAVRLDLSRHRRWRHVKASRYG